MLVEPVGSVDELNARTEWFRDSARPNDDCNGPFIVVADDFYPDPNRIREHALDLPFVQYSPPLAEYAGAELAARHTDKAGRWSATVNMVFRGTPLPAPFVGNRHSPPELRTRLSEIIHETIAVDDWEDGGDGWNGAFHLIESGWTNSSIHHHFRKGDIDGRGWSGVVYLSPAAPPSSGTSIWYDTQSGSCVATQGASYFDMDARFRLAYFVENRFNRLILLRENVLHRGEHGFGVSTGARLTQTLFFRSARGLRS